MSQPATARHLHITINHGILESLDNQMPLDSIQKDVLSTHCSGDATKGATVDRIILSMHPQDNTVKCENIRVSILFLIAVLTAKTLQQ